VVRGLFVTGTDTSVGKTVVSAALMHRYRDQLPLRYWKPIQTGIEQDDDTSTVARLGSCAERELLRSGVRLELPVSPHLAAQLAGQPIHLPSLIARASVDLVSSPFIIEGAGGVLVPLGDRMSMIELMATLGMPVLIVSRTSLGTINHTRLTLEALRARSLTIAGVVMVGPHDRCNLEAIEQYGNVEVVAEMPRFDPLTPDALSAWAAQEFDRRGRLLELMR
jgi:dethiobiotin synthetase